MASSSSSSSRNWVYDVFVSFRGEDVRKNFLSHLIKELDRKLIKTFIDNEIKKGESINPVLKQTIRSSRIAVVLFSENYGSSSWCLDELVEIVKCKEELDQVVIPIFYGLDPTHVRKQTGKFGQVFAKTCEEKSKNVTKLWLKSLTEVANLCGNHPQNWPNDAEMAEDIANDVLSKKLNFMSREEFQNFVGMEVHIAYMYALLHLESEEVRMIGIWGPSGIGKTSIARVLYSQLSHQFKCKIFIDKAFISKVMKKYENANVDDLNMKLHLVGSFLSKLLDKRDIKIDSFDAMRQMLKDHKVLIFIDDLDHQVVLDTLVGQTQWFGWGSRIVVITANKRFLRSHGIDHIYEVCLPSDELARKMFCKSAFGKYPPPNGLMEFSSKIASSAGNLPLGLHVLGRYVSGIEKEELIEMLPDLLKGLNGDIKKTLRVSYDGLDSEKDKAIFRYIACLFNGEEVSDIKLLLADSNSYVNTGLRNLVDKALIHIRYGIIEMHSLLQNMGKEIVRAQSNEPGEREFLMDAKEICDLLEYNTGTKVERLWEGVQTLRRLKELDLFGSKYLKEIPDLSKATSLEKLCLSHCSSLVELPSSIKYLNKLEFLFMWGSSSLETLPNGINLQSLHILTLSGCPGLNSFPETLPIDINFCSLRVLCFKGCSRLRIFPNFSTNIEKLILNETGIKEVPWWIENFTKLRTIRMWRCSKLVHVSLNIYKLKLLEEADFIWCEALSEASWNDHPIAIDEVLSGVEVPSYFIHQTTGYSLTNIPLCTTSLSQQLFKFRACVVVIFDSEYFGDIDVRCEFKDRLGNSFLWVSKNKVFIRFRRDSVVFVMDSLIPLDKCYATQAQRNYDHVDMEIHINDTKYKLKRWGIHLLEEYSLPANGLSNPDKFTDVHEDNLVSESEHSEECIQRVGKRQRETECLDFWEKPFKKMFSCVRKFF